MRNSKKQLTTYIKQTYYSLLKQLLQAKTTHMPYPCWIYNDDIQHDCVGINTCAVDMLNALPTDNQLCFCNCSQFRLRLEIWFRMFAQCNINC